MEEIHCVKSVHIRSYSGAYFRAFGLNNSEYRHFLLVRTMNGKIYGKSALHKIFFRFVCLVRCLRVFMSYEFKTVFVKRSLWPHFQKFWRIFLQWLRSCLLYFQNWNWYKMHSSPTRMTRRLGYIIVGCWAEVKYINLLCFFSKLVLNVFSQLVVSGSWLVLRKHRANQIV